MKLQTGKSERDVERRPEEELITESGTCGTKSIWHAIKKGHLPAVKYYVMQNPQIVFEQNESNDMTPLHYAARDGHLEIAEFIISKGAEIDAMDSTNTTPIMMASYKGRVPVVNLLLNKEAVINIGNVNGNTPLHHAVEGNRLEVVKLLIRKGANSRIRNFSNMTPMDIASDSGDRHSIETYLSSH